MFDVIEIELSDEVQAEWTKTEARLWHVVVADTDAYFVTSVAQADDEYPEAEVALFPSFSDGRVLGFPIQYAEDGTDVVGAIERSGFDFRVTAELVK